MSRRGMTLAETLTTTAIMGVLVGLLIPAVQHVREAARRTTCLNNLRQIGLSIHNYESSFGRLPPGTIGYAEAVDWNDFRKTPDEPYWKSVQHTSAPTLVLSYLEEDRENPCCINACLMYRTC